MEIEGASPEDISDRIETANGQNIFLFRYDNPQVPNRHPNSMVSQDELIGKWFTDSPQSLTARILMRPPGGVIVIAKVPKARLEQLRATNHPIAKDMDIEPDNFILPDELISRAQTIPLIIVHENPKKFLFKEVNAIRSFVDTLINQLKQPESPVPSTGVSPILK